VRNGLGSLVLAAVMAVTVVPGVATAQSSPLVVEVRGGASTALAHFRSGSRVGEGARSGPSIAVAFVFSGEGRRSTYVGFSQERFACAAAGCPAGRPFIATGLDGGFRFSLCTRCSVSPWLRIGGLTTRVESAGVPGSPAGVSRLAFGGEAGFGVYVGAWRSVAFDPGLRFAAVNTRLPGGSLLRMRYAVLDLGLVLAF
jgi:hypothetical protein